MASQDEEYAIKPLPINGPYNLQRFRQFCPEDTAGWYLVKGSDSTKRPFCMYPTFGRRHINYNGSNKLIFNTEPRGIFKTDNFAYVVVGQSIYQFGDTYDVTIINNASPLKSLSGNVYFTELVVNTITYACFIDDQKIYIYIENLPTPSFNEITDVNAPGNFRNPDGEFSKPGFIAAFGNRIVVSVANSSQFFLSTINLVNAAGVFDKSSTFTINGFAVFAQESGIIQQMGVLNTKLYIFTSFTTGIWSNTAAVFSGTNTTFPWKKNTTYEFNVGLYDPLSLDINFGRMCFLGRNRNGLIQVMVSDGGDPQPISSKAINVLFQKYANSIQGLNPFLEGKSVGFLYEYENTIFYRLSAGAYTGEGLLDQNLNANSLEYNFENDSWHRCIELNGERNRIQKHIFFNNSHLVTVSEDETIYEMTGIYTNEVRNLAQPNPQEDNAYTVLPFRYERISPIISEDDYSEFETQYVQIDFVWGDSDLNFSTAPFENTTFIIDEQLRNGDIQYIIAENVGADGQPIFMIMDNSNFPAPNDKTYNYLTKPSVELFFSDDGGISFRTADNRDFSQAGAYSWRMRWYQLGASRNRVYKLICVSPVPIIILGGVMNVRRISGGAN